MNVIVLYFSVPLEARAGSDSFFISVPSPQHGSIGIQELFVGKKERREGGKEREGGGNPGPNKPVR